MKQLLVENINVFFVCSILFVLILIFMKRRAPRFDNNIQNVYITKLIVCRAGRKIIELLIETVSK